MEKEYWTSLNQRKKYYQKIIMIEVFKVIIASFLIYLKPDDYIIISILVGGGFIIMYQEIVKIMRMKSHPFCRIDNEFIISGYDKKITPWNIVSRIIWKPTRSEAIVVFRIRPKTEKVPLTFMKERDIHIDGNMIENVDELFDDLKNSCDEKSVPFYVSDKGTGSQYDPFLKENEI
ncbi:MAG: hypothetical protein HXS53_04995 [Theionarchaea archaeon]|nr:hypothetical protein [Theionarchaea archaeon]